MSTEMARVAIEQPQQTIKNMIMDGPSPLNDRAPKVSPPIEFMTENGFSIMRLSALQPATVDSESECHFVVRHPAGEESDVLVRFVAAVVTQVQSQRKSPLSGTSDFWLTLAEQQLAIYLWKNNRSPAGGHLVISRLSGGDLELAARWTD